MKCKKHWKGNSNMLSRFLTPFNFHLNFRMIKKKIPSTTMQWAVTRVTGMMKERFSLSSYIFFCTNSSQFCEWYCCPYGNNWMCPRPRRRLQGNHEYHLEWNSLPALGFSVPSPAWCNPWELQVQVSRFWKCRKLQWFPGKRGRWGLLMFVLAVLIIWWPRST